MTVVGNITPYFIDPKIHEPDMNGLFRVGSDPNLHIEFISGPVGCLERKKGDRLCF